MLPSFISKSEIPHKPGIYIFRDEKDAVLYVGKAIDLYHRVSSYFSKGLEPRTARLVAEVKRVETTVVESELEALILEANLIKKHKPFFNVRLIDDKDYLYIAITKDDFPKIITARKKDISGLKKFFGPFPSAKTVRATLKQLRRVFPWCSKSVISPDLIGGRQLRPCFYYHIGLCPGPCAGKINKADYNRLITNFSRFLSGEKEKLCLDLKKQMEGFAKKAMFEDAQKIKRTIEGILYLTQPNRVARYLENPNFLQEENTKALEQLRKLLNLETLPSRIEAYDVSNIGGKDATGSMVVLTNGETDTAQYRRFKIRISGKPNDVGMHKEIMRRRLNHPEWGIPQLILVDGGRGQARASSENIKGENNLTIKQFNNIPIFGLAKRFEWLYPPEGEIIKLPKNSLALRLLQKIRDESHRFALLYHRKLRKKSAGL